MKTARPNADLKQSIRNIGTFGIEVCSYKLRIPPKEQTWNWAIKIQQTNIQCLNYLHTKLYCIGIWYFVKWVYSYDFGPNMIKMVKCLSRNMQVSILSEKTLLKKTKKKPLSIMLAQFVVDTFWHHMVWSGHTVLTNRAIHTNATIRQFFYCRSK